jgi:hypothetical protein
MTQTRQLVHKGLAGRVKRHVEVALGFAIDAASPRHPVVRLPSLCLGIAAMCSIVSIISSKPGGSPKIIPRMAA